MSDSSFAFSAVSSLKKVNQMSLIVLEILEHIVKLFHAIRLLVNCRLTFFEIYALVNRNEAMHMDGSSVLVLSAKEVVLTA